jgi:peptide/nickel transport system substrate-binding protein
MLDGFESASIRPTGRMTRRHALQLLGLSGLGIALLSACGQPASAPAPAADSKSAGAAAPAAPAAPAAAPAAKPAAPASKDGGTFRLFLHTENAPTLDPHMTVTFRSQEFAAFFYSRLLMSKKGPGIPGLAYQFEGDLAESWKVGEDGKTWNFTLRPDIKWHNKPPLNGRPLVAADVAWAFERFMKVSPQRTTFDQVAEVSAPDERTVQFKLKDIFAPFEAALGAPVFWVLPREVIEQDGDASKRVVGTGPFVFDKYESGVGFNGKKYPLYHRKGEPHVDELVATMIPDVATRMAAMRARELDGAEIEQQDLAPLKQTNPDIQIVNTEWNYNPYIYWKLDQPPFNDVRVRQAVSMSIDRDEFLKTTFIGQGGWNTSIPWAFSEWWLDPRGPDFGPNAKYFKYDPAEARKLLAAAGYPDGLKVDMIASPGYGEPFVQRVEVMQQTLKSGGIECNIKMQEYSAYIATTYLGKFEGGNVLVFGLTGGSFNDPNDFLFSHYHPKGPRNESGVNDPKLTEMIEKQVRTLDKADRKKQINEIQRYLAEQVYYATVGAGYRAMGYQPYVRDAYPRSDFGLGSEIIPKIWMDK